MHTYTIVGVDGKTFKVGSDCVERTGDDQLSASMKNAEYAYKRECFKAERKAWLESEAGQEWQAKQDGHRRGCRFREAEIADMRAQEKARIARSKHVGVVGDRGTVTLTIDAVIPLESAYGTKDLHIMTDSEGNRFVWFCSGSLIANPAWLDWDMRPDDYVQVDMYARKGDTVTVKATIKSHGERDGVKQTVLSRVVSAAKKGKK